MADLSRVELLRKLDKWLITAMSHMKTIYEDNDIPWSEENEEKFQAIRKLIQGCSLYKPKEGTITEAIKAHQINQRKVSREFVEKWIAEICRTAAYSDSLKRTIIDGLKELDIEVED